MSLRPGIADRPLARTGAPQPAAVARGHVPAVFGAWADLGADSRPAPGGKTVTPPLEIPGVVTFATFADPEGSRIGLVKG